jgi:hypothetical protein
MKIKRIDVSVVWRRAWPVLLASEAKVTALVIGCCAAEKQHEVEAGVLLRVRY